MNRNGDNNAHGSSGRQQGGARPNRTGGDLTITSEAVLVSIPRGDEELRVTYTKARTSERDVSWHSIRVFWKTQEGEWRPGKQGITIRARELEAVVKALQAQPEVERDGDDRMPF